MLPNEVRERMLSALRGTIDVIGALLGTYPSAHPIWDFRPDVDRFSLREVVAHLNDWEAIWVDRMIKTRRGSRPALEDFETDDLVRLNHYGDQDPLDSMASLRSARETMLAILLALSNDEWQLGADHSAFGYVTMET